MDGLDFQKLNDLAMNYDPSPVLQAMQQAEGAGGFGNPAAGYTTAPYTQMLNGAQAPAGATPNANAMDPKLMQSLMQAGAKAPPAAPHFMSTPAGKAASQIHMVPITVQPAAGGDASVSIPSLAALLQGQAYKR